MSTIHIKRIYDEPAQNDGLRVLVDRVWPRGVSKDKANLDAWLKDVAPSTQLRQWFGHDPAKWDEFRKRYFKELDGNAEHVDALKKLMSKGKVTLLFGAKDEQHNQAAALREYLKRA